MDNQTERCNKNEGYDDNQLDNQLDSDSDCDDETKAYFDKIFYIPPEILGVFDVQGIELSVWTERKEQKSLFSGQKPRMVNMIYAVNKQHQLKFAADVGSDYLGYDIDRSDRLVEKIKKEYSEGKLHMRLCSYKSVCLSDDIRDSHGVYISMYSMEGLPIKEIIYEKRISDLESKLADAYAKLAAYR